MNLTDQIPELVRTRLLTLAQDFNQCEDPVDCKWLLMHEADAIREVLKQMISEKHDEP